MKEMGDSTSWTPSVCVVAVVVVVCFFVDAAFIIVVLFILAVLVAVLCFSFIILAEPFTDEGDGR